MNRDSVSRLTVTLPSPKSAAESAAVYRRRRGERPRDRWLRILALAGALMVHLVFLFGAILGPAYEMEEINDETPPLVVRLIDHPKEEPPPPPPVRGTPPKQVGPVHKGNASDAPHTARRSSSSTRTNNDLAPVPVPAIQTPVVTDVPKAEAPKVEATAAPLPPVTVPKPASAEQLQPVPTAQEPPQVALETPAIDKPVPPKFQPEPEPVRKPQADGSQPMPPPASLAIPEVPPQSAPVVTPPTVAMEKAVPADTKPSIAPVARPEEPASPPEPEMQAVPLPAQAAPTVNLQPQPTPVVPVVPREQPKVESPAIRVAEEPQLEAVPLPPNAQPTINQPQAPHLDMVAPKAVALDNKPSIERPQLSETPAESAPAQSAATSSASNASSQSASTAQANSASSEASHTGESGESSAPNATPQGSRSGTPGQPNGVERSPSVAAGKGLNLALPPGQGNGNSNGNGGKGQGEQPEGVVGTDVQLKPHGNTEVMSHGTPNIGYTPTRFEKDWTPEGESSIDTALRHAVEKTTMRHTFNLPRGVRVECVVMPLFPMALFGCGDGNPPPAPVDDVVYDKMKLAPTNPLVPPSPSAGAVPTVATIKLDNSAQCAAARVAGGPLPPGCPADVTLPTGPARSSTTWVPASDQFH